MVKQIIINFPGFSRGFHLITPYIERQLPALPKTGILNLFLKHTSAALSINENADPSVRADFLSFTNRLVPDADAIFTHQLEGYDDMAAHIKSSLFGPSISIPIVNGRIGLGIWQGVYLCEFRNYGGEREIIATILE